MLIVHTAAREKINLRAKQHQTVKNQATIQTLSIKELCLAEGIN